MHKAIDGIGRKKHQDKRVVRLQMEICLKKT
uniref:Uncharacterized protein n=1 Tax=Erwinia amylovora ATCC BAA-2158 TaxID=889211 RepID=E5B6T4_ERWAM|nr:hypothetical protein predicted by Glimmer/Critica [Erwinia amylovora ATCC BAA-2158]